MKIGDNVYVHGYVDEIRKETVIIRNEGGYFGTVPSEIINAEPVRRGWWIFNPKDAIEMMFTLPKCSECGEESPNGGNYCPNCGAKMDEVEENGID